MEIDRIVKAHLVEARYIYLPSMEDKDGVSVLKGEVIAPGETVDLIRETDGGNKAHIHDQYGNEMIVPRKSIKLNY